MQTEAKRAYKRAWRKANRAKENAYIREYRAKYLDKYERLKAANRERYRAKADEIRAKKRARYAADEKYRRAHKSSNLSTLYGISGDEYTALVTTQQGRCAICQQPEIGPKRKHLSVDHDHKTGVVRGLLCHRCNAAVGLLNEDTDRARKLIAYLENSGAEILRAAS